ncbi:MAG: GspE/PulE family protein [Granulosicoccus sp.]
MIYDTRELPERLDLRDLIPSPEALACLAVDSARRLCVLPLAVRSQTPCEVLLVACSDASQVENHERVVKHIDSHYRLQFVSCPEHQLRKCIENSYREKLSLTALLNLAHSDRYKENEIARVSDYPIELVDALIRQAVRMRASDVHISPESDCIQIRLRIDGVLLHLATIDKALLTRLLVRIKIMASLDIAETRYPQDGQFRRLVDAYPIDFRVSTFPTVAGENTVLRLIDNALQLNSLSAFGLPAELMQKLSELVQKPDGLIVVCGPTGAGKSTTLFALLEQIDYHSLSVMTLEDPVEHRVPGIRQTTVDAARHWGYAQGLRALLRQDPDVLLIGEIRDSESCEMALRAVTTGHQVLTTVHARCAHSALHRLRELHSINSSIGQGLVAMIAQRLVRKLCSSCEAGDASCADCHGTGYIGRQVVMELLEVTTEIRSLLESGGDIGDIQAASARAGFQCMRDRAMALVVEGVTNEQEVNRVFGTGA